LKKEMFLWAPACDFSATHTFLELLGNIFRTPKVWG
jgi:hypothetical protein